MVVVQVPVRLARGELTVAMSVDDEGRLTGLRLTPTTEPWQPPDYADREMFDENDIVLGSDSLAVPGVLSLPRRPGRHPAVVLLAGGGPFDRDGTAGANKPLKDIAWGLASRGIAVLRFDMVTYAHGAELAADFTMADEYVPHAVAAVELLRAHAAVDADRVFVVGHSMGGKVAPRVAVAEPSVAGLVILAGDTEPMHWAAVRVMRYLAALDPETGAAMKPAIDMLVEQAKLIDSPDFSLSTPSNDLPLGLSARYWMDLRDYDPVAVAAMLSIPLFILQGGRDYQVTVGDDLTGWQTGLADRRDVTIRVYDADDHLFFPGSGPSKPADYEAPQHVDRQVVADIADWLATV
jgi:dienelactone hydrolase